ARNRLARETVGIAGAVEMLVARAHDRCNVEEGGRGGEDPFTDDDVALHERPLGFVQGAGLVEDRVRNRELADVVQLRRTVKLRNLGFVDSKAARDRDGQLGDAVDMVADVWMALAEDL